MDCKHQCPSRSICGYANWPQCYAKVDATKGGCGKEGHTTCTGDEGTGYCLTCHLEADLAVMQERAEKAEEQLKVKGEYGYSQFVVNGLTKERNDLREELADYKIGCNALKEGLREIRDERDKAETELVTKRQQNEGLVEALIHIHEYWNRGENDGAMNDALYHMIDTASEALQQFDVDGLSEEWEKLKSDLATNAALLADKCNRNMELETELLIKEKQLRMLAEAVMDLEQTDFVGCCQYCNAVDKLTGNLTHEPDCPIKLASDIINSKGE